MLAFRPHQVTVYPATENQGATGTVESTSFPAGNVIRGQITPLRHASTFERWGVESESPHEFLCNVSDATMVVGDRLQLGNRVFRVIAGPMTWNAETVTSCAAYLISEIQPFGDA